MKQKEVDDVMGGEGAWDNVDQTEGIHPSHLLLHTYTPVPNRDYTVASYLWQIDWQTDVCASRRQHNVRVKIAVGRKHTSTWCRFEVRMSR